MPPRRFTFDVRAGRYRNAQGRFVAHRQVRRTVDRVIEKSADHVAALAESLRTRRITLGTWEQAMRHELRALHLATVTAAKGGFAQMTFSDFGRAGQILRTQYRFLARFADDVQSGRVLLDGAFASRAALYPEAARASYQATLSREMARRGFNEEHNILDREAKHCIGPGSCPEQSARGWVPVGTLIPVGQRLCTVRDRCQLIYRNSQTGEVAA